MNYKKIYLSVGWICMRYWATQQHDLCECVCDVVSCFSFITPSTIVSTDSFVGFGLASANIILLEQEHQQFG